MLNAFIIVWRESLEAMLVIGILLSWIARQPDPAALRRRLWAGIAAGVALACSLGAATFAVQSELGGESLDIFQCAMVLTASALILQMVLWMHRHGRHMRRELESRAEGQSGAWGIAAITALAVGREGAETVVFLYGLGMESRGLALAGMLGAALGGFACAAVTAWLAARGARYLNYRTLFAISEALLLLIAHALLANAVDRAIALGWLPALVDPLWDVSAWLADGQGLGRVLADFAGYRASPAATLVLASLAFWAYALWRLRRPAAARAAAAAKA